MLADSMGLDAKGIPLVTPRVHTRYGSRAPPPHISTGSNGGRGAPFSRHYIFYRAEGGQNGMEGRAKRRDARRENKCKAGWT